MKGKIVPVFGTVERDMAADICGELLRGTGNVVMPICSYGGSDAAGHAIAGAMRIAQEAGKVVRTLGLGDVSSIATLILAAGTPGERWLDKHASVLIHEGGSEIGGMTYRQLGIWQKQGKWLVKRYCDVMERLTGSDFTQYMDGQDHWLSAPQARRIGLCDRLA